MRAMDCGSGEPQPRNGLYDKKAEAESQTLGPGLDFSLEVSSRIELCLQPMDGANLTSSLIIRHRSLCLIPILLPPCTAPAMPGTDSANPMDTS